MACKLIIVPEPFLLRSLFAWLPPLPSNSPRAAVVVQWRRWRATERVYKNMHATELRQGLAKES